MTAQPVRVAFLPVYPNPYQGQLARAVAGHNVSVQMLDRMPSESWLHENAGRVHVLHLHWLYGIYMARFQTPLRAVAFWRRLSLAQELGYGIVWTAHNILPHRPELRPLHAIVRARIMREADAVIVHCQAGETELRRRFARRGPIHVIPIGHTMGLYPVTMSRAAARQSLGLHPDQFVYLFLGLLAPYKGLDRLLEAFWRIAGDDDVLLIGGESLNAAVSRQVTAAAQADTRIHLHLGHIPDDDMQRFLLSADVMVTPYRAVLTSSTAVLALSYGLPVVAPSLGCLPELITPEVGLVYDATVTGSLPAALRAAKSFDLAAMRANALARAEQLDWDTIGRDTATVYRASRKT